MRLIDADALSELVGEPVEVFLSRLDLKLPPTVDAVPVIRCKDCKWFSIIGYCDLLRFRIVDSYKYCAWAERKEE